MKRLKIILPVLAAGILLCSCAEKISAAGSSEAAKAAQETKTEPAELTALQRSDGWNFGALTEGGMYFVSSDLWEDNSTNLMYLDYETMAEVFLCSQPNCTHDSDACTSYLPYSSGGILVEAVGEKLYLVFNGNIYAGEEDQQQSVLPHFEVMNPDGSDRRTSITFEANQELSRPMVTDGQAVYGVLSTASEEKLQRELVKIDPIQGTTTTLMELDGYWLSGAAGTSLVLHDSENNYFLYEIDTGTITEVYQETDPWTSATLFGEILLCKDNGYFCIHNLKTGKETPLTGYAVPTNGETTTTMLDADEDHLIFYQQTMAEQSGTDLPDGFYMLTADQEPQRWELLYEDNGEDEAVIRAGSAMGGNYLVIAGRTSARQGDSQSGYLASGRNQYALISRQDYWNGIANYTASVRMTE